MRHITDDDLRIFDEVSRLYKVFEEKSKVWLAEVKSSHRGELAYEDTRPSFDVYLSSYRKWKKFFDGHSDILLAKVDS